MAHVGGLKPTEINAEVQDAFAHARAEIDGKLGDSAGADAQILSAASQVVAGKNFFLKVKFSKGTHQVVHVRLFKSLQQQVSVNAIQTHKTEADALEYFDRNAPHVL